MCPDSNQRHPKPRPRHLHRMGVSRFQSNRDANSSILLRRFESIIEIKPLEGAVHERRPACGRHEGRISTPCGFPLPRRPDAARPRSKTDLHPETQGQGLTDRPRWLGMGPRDGPGPSLRGDRRPPLERGWCMRGEPVLHLQPWHSRYATPGGSRTSNPARPFLQGFRSYLTGALRHPGLS